MNTQEKPAVRVYAQHAYELKGPGRLTFSVSVRGNIELDDLDADELKELFYVAGRALSAAGLLPPSDAKGGDVRDRIDVTVPDGVVLRGYEEEYLDDRTTGNARRAGFKTTATREESQSHNQKRVKL